MRNLIALLAATALLGGFGLAAPASAQSIDKNGKCHAADGKMAKMEVCTAASAKKAQCRDDQGKFIKCEASVATAAAAPKPAATTQKKK